MEIDVYGRPTEIVVDDDHALENLTDDALV